jgi:DNA invertase Pin-like site-specific DNA recombinase
MIHGYARVSTEDQNCALQVAALKAAGVPERNIVEENGSGGDPNRPKLKRLLDSLQRGDQLVVWKLDRLARTLSQLVEVGNRLKDQGVELRSLTESIDTRSPYGKAMYGLMGIFAELERDMIRERTVAGLKAAAAKGRKGGRPAKLSVEQKAIAREMLANNRHSVGEVARVLRVGRATIYRALVQAHPA